MAVLALDIGTTKICAMVMNEESGEILEIRSENNNFLSSSYPWEKKQNPDQIFFVVQKLVSLLLQKYQNFRCIGVTGQMHSVLHWESTGKLSSFPALC